MKVLLRGYSGYATIEGHNILMTSFSLSMSENIVQSGGIGKLLLQSETWKRYKMDALRDYPSYAISISCDANEEIINYVIDKITSKYYSYVNVKFYDETSGISYEFDNCCLTSMQLGVSADASAAGLSLGFTSFKDEIEVEFGTYSCAPKRNAPEEFIGATLMPYWAWGVEYPDFNDKDLYEFNISYSQSVVPKFGCYGEASGNAPKPKKIIFGLPELKYDLTYIVANKTKLNDYTIHSNEMSISNHDLVVKYHANGNGIKFKMTDCYPDSHAPIYANSGDVNKITVSGTAYGTLERI